MILLILCYIIPLILGLYLKYKALLKLFNINPDDFPIKALFYNDMHAELNNPPFFTLIFPILNIGICLVAICNINIEIDNKSLTIGNIKRIFKKK